MTIRYYTGVGSRNTPPNILELMFEIAAKLNSIGYYLRSGGAAGADTAFANGAGPLRHIFLAEHSTLEAEAIAKAYHPAWERCSGYVKRLHGRNAFQVLGITLNQPSDCLVCWTPDGCISHAERTIKTGGTGTAISIADAYNVSVFNLQRADHFALWMRWARN